MLHRLQRHRRSRGTVRSLSAGDGLHVANVVHASGPVFGSCLEPTADALSFGLVGAVVARHRPGNTVGWLLLAIGGASAATLLTAEYAMYGQYAGRGLLPGSSVSSWLSTVTLMSLLALIPIAVQLFPDGRPVSKRWRILLRLCIANGILLIARNAFTAGNLSTTQGIRNPFGILPAGSVAQTLDGMT